MGLFDEKKESNTGPFLLFNELKVIDVNEEACDLVKFSREEILGKNIKEISSMLRCHHDFNVDCLDKLKSIFIFDKFCEPIEVTIEMQNMSNNEVKYFIKELPNGKIEKKLPLFEHLFKDKEFGMAVYSAPNMTLLKANEVWFSFFDKPFNNKDVTVGLKLSEFIKGWTGSLQEQLCKNMLETGEALHLDEYVYHGFERGITYWDISFIPIFEEGFIKYVVGMTKDITEKVKQRKIMEEQARTIQQQKRQLEAVFQNIEDIMCIVDKDGSYLKTNKLFSKYLEGIKIESSKDLYSNVKFYDLDGKQLTFEEMPTTRVRHGEKLKNLKLCIKVGDTEVFFNVTGTPVFDEENNFQTGIVLMNDITDEVQKTKVIEEQKEKLNAIIANSSDGLVMLDKNMNAAILNEAGRNFFYKPETIKRVGDAQKVTTYYDINGDKIPMEKLPGIRALKGEVVKAMRIKVERPDKTFHVDISGSPIYDSKKELIGSVYSVRYLDEAIKYEEMLKKQRDELQQLLKMKEEFFSFISHEFKTPLTVMSSIIQLLKLVYKNQIPDKVMGYINKLNLSTLQQIRLVNNLLDITRGESGYLKVNKRNSDIVSMTRVIADSVSNFAARKSINLQFNSEVSELNMDIDDEKYERILLNLLSNAIKFTPEEKSIAISLNAVDDKVIISIQDEGVGIPEDKLEVIFERFGQVNSKLTRQGEGTGIGLCLVKTLIEALEGDIKVESKVGQGSTFTVILPAVAEENCNVVTEGELMDNRLVQSMDIEFSNIYFD